jgi:hypothetical protein
MTLQPKGVSQFRHLPADWINRREGFALWWLPGAALLISALIGTRIQAVTWPLLLTYMGVACLLNARRCGRIHCYFTGPFFLLLALVALLHGSGVLSLGQKGWSLLTATLVVGFATLFFVPEWLLGRYRSPDGTESPAKPEDGRTCAHKLRRS